MPQVAENIFSKGICENFWNLFVGINLVHDNFSITNKTSKVMILDGNMLCPWSELWDLLNSDTYFIIFPDSAMEYWISCQ